jgi:RecA-family ATPase
MTSAALAQAPNNRGTETYKQSAIMGAWAVDNCISRDVIWAAFEEAAKANGHLEDDAGDFTRSFDRGFKRGYLETIEEGRYNRAPIQRAQNDTIQLAPVGTPSTQVPSQNSYQALFGSLFPPPADLKTFRADELLSTAAPAREWLLLPFMPHAEVTLFAGDGGGGKSTLCLQLAMACAGAKDWLGRKVKPCNVLYISAEDPKSELHYRLEQINKHERISSDDLAHFRIIDLSGVDATALAISDTPGQIRKTPLFDQIERIAKEHDAALIILDATADFFGGDENVRSQVRAFIGLLRGLAMRLDAAILLIAHPSVEGMKTQRGYSGSTHWNNAVRSRLTFTDEPAEANTPSLDVKVLELAKSNRARRGEKIRMTWFDGRFVPLAPGASANPAADKHDQEVFLELLKKLNSEGIRVVPERGKAYAPAVMKNRAGGKDIGNARLERAMHALLDAERIVIKKEGPPSKPRRFLAPKE